MGYGYELKCKKCGFSCDVYLGVGFRYPRLCMEALEKMKNGEFGKRFMKDAKETPYAAVHLNRSILVCDNCGERKTGIEIDLCAPIGEHKKRENRFCVELDDPKDLVYVMNFEIGKKYSIVRSKQHRCGKCYRALRPMKKGDLLKCPECGGALKKGDEINWD